VEEPKVNTDRLIFDLTNEIKDIKVNEAVEFVPVTEVTQNGVIRHSLEEYMEVESQFVQAKKEEPVVEVTPAELNITVKQVENQNPVAQQSFVNDAFVPTEMSIEDSLKLRAEERRRKMKEFNYKFHNNAARVEEFEKVPAYKRMGIDVTNNPVDNNRSRLSLGLDSNDDIQLRSNNSFLHDNVD
jgi:cell division protein FtsZ